MLTSRTRRSASWLLVVEVPIVLRRLLHGDDDKRLLNRCLDRFDADVQDIGLVDALTDVALRIRSDHRLSQCRALDAVHACTAPLLQEWTGRTVRMATFDQRMGTLASDLNLA